MMRDAGVLTSCSGQATVEAAVAITLVVAGFVFMAVYSQRAIQGNLFSTSQAVGSQFDPRDGYNENHNLTLNETAQQKVMWSMVDAALIKAESAQASPLYKVAHPTWVLESLPTGPIAREPAASQNRVDTSWDTSSNANYNDSK